MAAISSTVSPSTLEHLATLKTAICLLDHKIMLENTTPLFHLNKPLPTDQIPLPNVLIKRLETYTKSMTDKIWDWTSFHYTEELLYSPLLYLDHVVWYDDGIIDYFSTAENLLRNSALSDLQKFNIAKVYFFIDYITEKYEHVPKDEMKTWYTPLDNFCILKEIAHLRESGYNLIRVHKRMAEFLNWYLNDSADITFTLPMLLEVEDSNDETLDRTPLLGLGYGVSLPM